MPDPTNSQSRWVKREISVREAVGPAGDSQEIRSGREFDSLEVDGAMPPCGEKELVALVSSFPDDSVFI